MLMKIREIEKMKTVVIDDCKKTTLEEFMAVVRYGAKVQFSEEFCRKVAASRALIDRFLEEGRAIYGVTTGFGENVRYAISTDDAVQLQKNIVRSHACAVGKPLSREEARAAMMMTIINLGQATSGIKLDTLELIRDLLNKDIYPHAPSEGSVGYLGVEAHLALTYMGEGWLYEDGIKMPAAQVLENAGLKPITLMCKEGLSMLNGSMVVTALSLIALFDSVIAMKNLEIAGALVYEALRGTVKALDPRIHANKSHPEQVNSAANLRRMLDGSEISEKYIDAKVQDAYVLRSMPHIHAGSYRLVKEAYDVIMAEMHSCSDNPEIFETEDGDGVALMCGNFDGTLVGSHDDMLGMAAAIAATIAERCVNRMTDHDLSDGLPAFLVANPGLNNGFMIPQYTAAGLCAEIKLLAVPASIDSISTCASQEDPVSMAYNSAVRACSAARKLEYVIAIDIMTALQAIDFLKPLKQSPALAKIHDYIRETVAFIDEDRFFQPDIETIFKMVRSGKLIDIMEDEIGEIVL